MPDALRKTISATESPALLNASPYTTKWMLYRRFKLGEDLAAREHKRMDWGKRMEPLLLQAAAEELHLDVIPNADGEGGSQAYVRRNLLGCTRDARIICPDRGPGALEVKVCFDYSIWMRDWNAGRQPPRHIEIQNQQQQYVGDGEQSYRWGVIGVWCAGEMTYFQRKPIPELWEILEREAAQFFDDVANDREPAPFGAPVEIPFLARAFPLIRGKELDLSELSTFQDITGDGLIAVPEEDKRRLKLMEDARLLKYHEGERLGHERAERALKAEMLAVARDAEILKLPEGVEVKLRQVKRGAYEVKPTVYKTVDVFAPGEAPL